MSDDFAYRTSHPTPYGVSLVRDGVDLLVRPMTQTGVPDADTELTVLPGVDPDVLELAFTLGRTMWLRHNRSMIQWLSIDLRAGIWSTMIPTQIGGPDYVRRADPNAFHTGVAPTCRLAGSILTGVQLDYVDELDNCLPQFDGLHFVLDMQCGEWGRVGFFERLAGRCYSTTAIWVVDDTRYLQVLRDLWQLNLEA